SDLSVGVERDRAGEVTDVRAVDLQGAGDDLARRGKPERIQVERRIELNPSAAGNSARRKGEVGRRLGGAGRSLVPVRSHVWIREDRRVLDLASSHLFHNN